VRIAFYAPFKPLDHPNPSGDLIIGNSLLQHLHKLGHQVHIVSRLRSRWIFWQPEGTRKVRAEIEQVEKDLRRDPVDIWLTYHCYYKAPDLLGPTLCKRLRLPYLIFQGSYATKYQRDWNCAPGFHLNRKALLAADRILVNRHDDLVNLQRLRAADRIGYIKPGIQPDEFTFDPQAREELRKEWDIEDAPVILSAAMFRDDVKTEGLAFVINSCLRLHRQGLRFKLVIAGEGPQRSYLKQLAGQLPRNVVHFTGKIAREAMYRFYSAGDVFVFPGINESLGMVFLEAQSCGLPVVAFANGGIPEVVKQEKTALLTPLLQQNDFDRAVMDLLVHAEKREAMGERAARFIREEHDIDRNYQPLDQILEKLRQNSPAQEKS
jgi:glycosyltransferase involved in cell wall biosynthesis